MAKQLLFYERIAPLSRDRHADWSIRRDADYSFTAAARVLPLTVSEFASAAVDLPIVLIREGGGLLPAAVLGLDRNGLIDAAGRWTGGYIPAFARRYPFVFSTEEGSADLTFCIDEGFAGLDPTGAEGTRLFAPDGRPSAFLQEMLDFSRAYRAEFERTVAFTSLLVELDLIEDARTTLTWRGGAQRVLDGFFMVGRRRLAALGAAQLKRLMALDGVEAAYLHLWSLRNFDAFVERFPTPAASPAHG
jgi:hypothetical protein